MLKQRDVVEDVETGARLHDSEERDHTATEHEHLYQLLDVLEAATAADDHEEEKEEAAEERHLLRHDRAQRVESPGIREQRKERYGHVGRDWRSEPTGARTNARVDQERREPREEDECDEHAIGLELDRQARRECVAPERDEQHEQDRHREQRAPLQELPVPNSRNDSEENGRGNHPHAMARRGYRCQRDETEGENAE